MSHRVRRHSAFVSTCMPLCILAMLALSSMAGAQRADGRIVEKPTLVADKISYLPDETMIFSGSSWKPGEAVTIVIKAGSAGIVATVQGAADENGILNISATMPKLPSSGSADNESKNTPILTATATGSSGKISTQFTLGHAPTDAERLISEEEYWNHRLTYPTGRYSPAWVRKAAEQDRAIKRGVPAGHKGGVVNPAIAIANGVQPLNASSFLALGPMPEHMTGCSGCYDYGTTEGRVNTIVTDPTTTTNGSIVAYLGNVGGGVWKTTNCCTSSTTWSVTTDSPLLSTTSIDTLAIDPNNHNTIYAGTGDLNYGSFSMGSQGILQSTDGGNTWTVLGASVFGPEYSEPAGNYPQYDSVGKVRVDPNNSNNIVAGTKKGLWFSYDQGQTWANCLTNTYTSQRQDITGLELTDMGGGVTRVLAAVGVRGFPTYVQYDLGLNGANGIYSATMAGSGCPTFASIASNSNGFVFGTQVSGSPYLTGALMNAGSGVPCNYPYLTGTTANATYCGNGTTGGSTTNGGTVNNLGRIDIAVAPSNPNVIYAQVGSINWNSASGCGGVDGCQLGAWASTDGGNTWSFMTGSAGGSLAACASSGTGSGTAGGGDYSQNWYDQGIAVDPNNSDRVIFDTFDIWLATRTGTAWYDLTCGYNGNSVSNHAVHVDQHALAFVHGSSDYLLVGNDGGVHATLNASTAALNTARPTWTNMDGGIIGIEFYSGDISGNFATSANPSAVAGAQDNGPSSVMFSGTPTGPAQWQMGTGGDGFSGLIDPMGTGSTQAQGTITLTTGGATAGQQFQIGSQVFTFVTSGTATGNVVLNSSTTTEGNNIVTSITRDIPTVATAARSGATVVVTAVTGGTSGNSIVFNNINASNFSMNGSGLLGGTTPGNNTGSLRYWEGNNSGGFSRCINNCTQPGATWTSWSGSWTSDTQSFVLPVHIFRGGIAGGDDCAPAGLTSGCGHLLAGTTRVWETITGTSTKSWYVTNNPITTNLTKGNLGNRSYINQVKFSPKYQSVAIVGTNDGNVQIGFNLGTGTQAQANWVNVTGGNAVLPNRPIQGIALDPSSPAVGTPIGYAAVGGFNNNSPSTPGHVFRVVCTMTSTPCDGFTWTDMTGNLPDIPVDSVIVNPNYPSQVYAGTDFGLYYTDDITANPPVWNRFNSGLPNVMVWDMTIDRGSTTLALWTRSRGAFVWPLPSGPESGPAGAATMSTPATASTLTGTSVNFTWYQSSAAQAYWIDVGSAPGGHNYYSSGSLPTTTLSQTVTSLPSDGSTVYVTLYTLVSGTWASNAYTYTAIGGSSSRGAITSPTNNTTLTGSSVAFSWSAGSGATGYWVDAGSTAGGHDYYSSGNLGNVLTTTVSNLPSNGSTVYVTLYSLVGGNWLSNAYTYTAFNLAAADGVISSPNPGSTLTGSSVTFTWSAGSGASAYWLDVGSTTGGHDYYSSGNLGNVLTVSVNGLPTDGSPVYVTLYSLIGSTWSGNTYNYAAINASSGLATIQSPSPNTMLSGNAATFTWSVDANAMAYWMDIGTAPGGNTIYSSGNLGNVQTTSVTSLPANGSTIYVTLYSYVGGQWLSTSATYVSGP